MKTLAWSLGGAIVVAALSVAMQIVVPRVAVYLVDRLEPAGWPAPVR